MSSATESAHPTEILAELDPQLPYTRLRGRYGPYLADPALIDAANVALGLDMPLLLTGEPGCGKTDFAYVVARALAAHTGHDQPLKCQIRSDVGARSLLYHYDALLRFTDGHHGSDDDRLRARDARNYVELRPLGVALTSQVRRVVLIDEIDKAPRDLPNDLLRELERGTFEIPEIRDATSAECTVLDPHTGVPLTRVMRTPPRARKPMVVITSNVERQLPNAFLRRCVFFHIKFPDEAQLRCILRAHFATDNATGSDRPDGRPSRLRHSLDERRIGQIAVVFLAARNIPGLAKLPSTAELLDWVRALDLFRPAHVADILARFQAQAQSTGARPAWSELPAVTCLFKLREDLERARA